MTTQQSAPTSFRNMRLSGVNEKQTSFDSEDVILVGWSENSSCEVFNISANTSSASQNCCDDINFDMPTRRHTSSKDKKACENIFFSNTSSTSQKLCKVINLTKEKLSQAKTKKKKPKCAKEITIHKEKSFCLLADQPRSNVAGVPIKKCKRRKHKCQKNLPKHDKNQSKNGKLSESQKNKEYSKTSLHIPECFKRDRILPCCFRYKCRTEATQRSCRTTSREVTRQHNSNNEDEKSKHKSNKKHRHQKRDSTKKSKESTEDKNWIGELSPISMSPLPEYISSNLDISYEDISMGSFTTESDVEQDISMVSFTAESEVELDTLIKRTKERERTMVYGKFFLPLNVDRRRYQTSTPYMHCFDNEDGSTVYTGDMDVSVHSLSTVVLTPHIGTNNNSMIGTEVYSPTMSPNNLFSYRRNSQETINLSDSEVGFETTVHSKIEPYSPSVDRVQVTCPEYVQMVLKKETTQDTPVEGVVCRMSSTVIKDEKIGDTEVKVEPHSPSPKILKNSVSTVSEFKDIKKDDNYNYVPIDC